MKFAKFLEEQQIDDEKNAIIDKIKNDCGYFLSLVKKPVYRGIRHRSPELKEVLYKDDAIEICKFSVRNDRKPSSDNVNRHRLFNYFFDKVFGIKNWRSKSIFTTMSVNECLSYGLPSVIFPIGNNIHCAFSENVSDTISLLSWNPDFGVVELFRKTVKEIILKYTHSEENTSMWYKMLEVAAPWSSFSLHGSSNDESIRDELFKLLDTDNFSVDTVTNLIWARFIDTDFLNYKDKPENFFDDEKKYEKDFKMALRFLVIHVLGQWQKNIKNFKIDDWKQLNSNTTSEEVTFWGPTEYYCIFDKSEINSLRSKVDVNLMKYWKKITGAQ